MDDRNLAVANAQSGSDASADSLYLVDPWGRYPGARSRINGLGGKRRVEDASAVFETATLIFGEDAKVKIVVELSGFRGDFTFMFLNLTNASVVEGSPELRLQMLPVELHADRGELQRYEVEFDAHRQIAYRLSGHIHGSDPLRADAITIFTSQPHLALKPKKRRSDVPRKAVASPDEAVVRGTPRIYDEAEPSFERLRSQPMTRSQLSQPSFLRLRNELLAFGAGPDADLWPEAFAIRVAEAFKLRAGGSAIGFDAAGGRLWKWLLRSRARVLLSERTFDGESIADMGGLRADLLGQAMCANVAEDALHLSVIGEALPPEYCGSFDFSWWITEAESDWKRVARGVLNVAESLSGAGVGVASFPIAYGNAANEVALVAERDLPRLILELLSAGHQIMQVCMPSSRVDAGVTQFAFIIRNAARDDTR